MSTARVQLFVAFLLAFALLPFSFAQVTYTCTDTDNGNSPQTFGTVSIIASDNSFRRDVPDSCYRSSLTENFCLQASGGPTTNFLGIQRYYCPNGCDRNECVPEGQQPSQSPTTSPSSPTTPGQSPSCEQTLGKGRIRQLARHYDSTVEGPFRNNNFLETAEFNAAKADWQNGNDVLGSPVTMEETLDLANVLQDSCILDGQQPGSTPTTNPNCPLACGTQGQTRCSPNAPDTVETCQMNTNLQCLQWTATNQCQAGQCQNGECAGQQPGQPTQPPGTQPPTQPPGSGNNNCNELYSANRDTIGSLVPRYDSNSDGTLDDDEIMTALRAWRDSGYQNPTHQQILVLMAFKILSCDMDVLNQNSHLECQWNTCTEVQGAGQNQCQTPNVACGSQPAQECNPNDPNSCGAGRTCTQAGACIDTNATCPQDFDFRSVAARQTGTTLIVGAGGACINEIRLAISTTSGQPLYDSNWQSGNTLTWNGRDNNNAAIPAGRYPTRISVRNGQTGQILFREGTITVDGQGGQQPGTGQPGQGVNCPANFSLEGVDISPNPVSPSATVTFTARGNCIDKVGITVNTRPTTYRSGLVSGRSVSWALSKDISLGTYQVTFEARSSDDKSRSIVRSLVVASGTGGACDPKDGNSCTSPQVCNPTTRRCESPSGSGRSCSISTAPTKRDTPGDITAILTYRNMPARLQSAQFSCFFIDENRNLGGPSNTNCGGTANDQCSGTCTLPKTGRYEIRGELNPSQPRGQDYLACTPALITVGTPGSTTPPGRQKGERCSTESNWECAYPYVCCWKQGYICTTNEECTGTGTSAPAPTTGTGGRGEGESCKDRYCRSPYVCCIDKNYICMKNEACVGTGPTSTKKPEGNRCYNKRECESGLECCRMKDGPKADTCQQAANCETPTSPSTPTQPGSAGYCEKGVSGKMCGFSMRCCGVFGEEIKTGESGKCILAPLGCPGKKPGPLSDISLACNDVCEAMYDKSASTFIHYDQNKDGYISAGELRTVDSDYFQKKVTRGEAVELAVFSYAEFNYLDAGQNKAEISLKQGWNMISAPGVAVPLDEIRGSCALGKGEKAWFWNGNSYEASDVLEPLKGYWIYADADCTASVLAEEGSMLSEDLHAGWNMISSSRSWSEVRGDCERTGSIWSWDPAADEYMKVPSYDNMDPTAGYWVKVKKACTIVS